jgi:uncharacterized protein (DUF2141 family)
MSLISYFFLIFELIFAGPHIYNKNYNAASEFQNSDCIELIINNIRNNKGVVQIGIYRSEKQYPDNPQISLTLPKDSLIAGRLRVFIPVKEHGSYSISILDDENSNDKMDYRLGLFPREGFGFSNNPKIKGLKEPSFSDKSFVYTGGKKVVSIDMVYIL